MGEAERATALRRIEAFASWGRGELDIDAAAAAAGLSRSRFYRLAAEWRAAPSLSALGVGAAGGRRRSRLDPAAVNRLQSVVPEIVRMNVGASVSRLVSLMVAKAAVTEGLPGAISLRAIVEAELRRVAATGEAGHVLRFDCSAVGLPQADSRPFTLFACIDAGTGLVLGSAMGQRPDAVAGYAAAARDARARIDALSSRLHWAPRLTRIELVAGVDVAASAALIAGLDAAGVRANSQLATAPKRYGRYMRAAFGSRLGAVAITPSRTEEGPAMPDNGDMTPWSLAEASEAMRVAVDRHNDGVVARARDEPVGREPEDLERALAVLSAAG